MISSVGMIREDHGLEKERHDHHSLVGVSRHGLAIVHEQLDESAKGEPEVHYQMRSIAIDQLPQVVLDVVEARPVRERDVAGSNVLVVKADYRRRVHVRLDEDYEREEKHIVD